MSGMPDPELTKIPASAELEHGFREELAAVSWYHRVVAGGEALPTAEPEAVAYSLHLALERTGAGRVPRIPLADMSQYVAVHAVNVALLSMAFAEYLGMPRGDVREVGLAGLLHDVGMVIVPVELLSRPGQLEPPERDLIMQHPGTGASLIVQSDRSFELAAVVAYEHHLRPDGSGYPVLRYPRLPHYVSRLVQLCDAYHALSSPRPFREPWPLEVILSFMSSRAGLEFDGELARAFSALVRRH